MESVRFPVAADNTEDSNTESVSTPKQFAIHNHRVRARKPFVAVESLGCLSLLDEGGRPRALPSPDVTYEHSTTDTKVHVQPIIQRPRAVLSSPVNDELICELQGQPDKGVNTASDAPKAPLSPLEGLTSVGEQPDNIADIANDAPKAPLSPLEGLTSVGGEIFADQASISINDSSPSVSSSLQDHDDTSNSKVSMSEPGKKEPAGYGIGWEHKSVPTKRNGNDENLSNANGRNRVTKRAGCPPSNASNVGLKEQHKPTAKCNSGRVIRPWY